MRFDIIGAGKIGKGFAKYLFSKGHSIGHVVNSTKESSAKAVEFIGAGEPSSIDDIGGCDVVLMGVRDDSIRQIFIEMKDKLSGFKAIGHFSGAYPSSILRECDLMGIGRFSIHPNASFADPSMWKRLDDVYFVMEGNEIGREIARNILISMGVKYGEISEAKKIFYHAGAVFSSNFVVGIMAVAKELYSMAELDPEISTEISTYLAKQAIENVKNLGLKDALTGPVARGDIKLVKAEEMAITDAIPSFGFLYSKFVEILKERVISSEHSEDRSNEG